MRRTFLLIAAAAVGFVALSSQLTHAAGVVGSGTPESCTEEAFLDAFDGGGDVTFDCGAAPHTITLGGFSEATVDTSIFGEGLITLSGANESPFFHVDGGALLLLDGLTLTRGLGSYGAIENVGTLVIQDSRIEKCNAMGAEQGTITNYGNLTILGATFAENTSADRGGAIFSYGGTVDIAESTFIENSTAGTEGHDGGAVSGFFFANILVADSTFTGNFSHRGGAISFDGVGAVRNVDFVGNEARETANVTFQPSSGGALFLSTTADVEITDSRFEGNAAAELGGAIANFSGVLLVERSWFTHNEAEAGGGIYSNGAARIADTTLDGNFAFLGAAIVHDSTSDDVLTLENSTVSDNVGGEAAIVARLGPVEIRASTVAGNTGAGVLAEPPGFFLFSNSIIADNSPSDCSGVASGASEGFNIASDDSCPLIGPGDDSSTDPLLGPLADNGGPTLTRLPDPLSPAVDEGQCLFPNDQRGVLRPQGAACDRGAVERGPEDATTTTTTSTVTTTTTLPGGQTCGDPVGLVATREVFADAANVTASDALAVLNAAVGLFACELCVCDVDGSGTLAATDALQTLRVAVGLGGALDCPACA